MNDKPTPPAPSEDIIRYDRLAQEALRNVVKQVIGKIAQMGALPGNHHFYVTFDTNAAGVKLSAAMKKKYPEEMTIVIQHQYWNLKATGNRFSISLSFNDRPEDLTIPYAAIKGFFDPSVQFGLQFETDNSQEVQEIREVGGAQAKKSLSDKSGDESESKADSDENASAEIVSLDKYRKK